MRTLFIITGAPGAGKTTYGKQVAKEQKAAFLDIDTATETLVRRSLDLIGKDPSDRDSLFFKKSFRQPIYDTLFAIARENLPHADVVITGPFTSEKRNPHWHAELKARFEADIEIHYVTCDQETLKRRISHRRNPRDAAKLANWEEYANYHDAAPPLYPHTLVKSGGISS